MRADIATANDGCLAKGGEGSEKEDAANERFHDEMNEDVWRKQPFVCV